MVVPPSPASGGADGTVPGRPPAGDAEPSEPRPPVLVSACLVGVRCTYDADHKACGDLLRLGERHRLIPVCPETAGGLPTPRPPAERQPDGTVRTADGTDVTEAYRRGAEAAVRIARATGARVAVLKARSPACGTGQIYDGTFTGRLVAGDGVAAQALRSEGLLVVDEEHLDRLGRLSSEGGEPPGVSAPGR